MFIDFGERGRDSGERRGRGNSEMREKHQSVAPPRPTIEPHNLSMCPEGDRTRGLGVPVHAPVYGRTLQPTEPPGHGSVVSLKCMWGGMPQSSCAWDA